MAKQRKLTKKYIVWEKAKGRDIEEILSDFPNLTERQKSARMQHDKWGTYDTYKSLPPEHPAMKLQGQKWKRLLDNIGKTITTTYQKVKTGVEPVGKKTGRFLLKDLKQTGKDIKKLDQTYAQFEKKYIIPAGKKGGNFLWEDLKQTGRDIRKLDQGYAQFEKKYIIPGGKGVLRKVGKGAKYGWIKIGKDFEKTKEDFKKLNRKVKGIKVGKVKELFNVGRSEISGIVHKTGEAVGKVVDYGANVVNEVKDYVGDGINYLTHSIKQKIKTKSVAIPHFEFEADRGLYTCAKIIEQNYGTEKIKNLKEEFKKIRNQEYRLEKAVETNAISNRAYKKGMKHLEKLAKTKLKELGNLEQIIENKAEKQVDKQDEKEEEPKKGSGFYQKFAGKVKSGYHLINRGVRSGYNTLGDILERIDPVDRIEAALKGKRPHYALLLLIIAVAIFSFSQPSTTSFIIFEQGTDTLNYKLLLGTGLLITAVYTTLKIKKS